MAFGKESSAAKSARVKMQLRDKKGRWIEMGGGVKWYSANLGKYMFGKAVDNAGNGQVKVEVEGASSNGKPLTVNIPASQVEKVKAKASLSPAANEKIDPAQGTEAKSNVEPPKEKNNALFEDMHKNPASAKNPFGDNYEEVPFDPKGTNTLEKNDLVLFTDSGVMKKGQVIGFQEGKPIIQPEVSPQWGFGGKGSIQPLVNVQALFKPITESPSDAGSDDNEAKSNLIPEAQGEAKLTPGAPQPAFSEPKSETEVPTADSKSDEDFLGNPVATSGNVKVTSNEKVKPGSFYVENTDGKKDSAVHMTEVKVGDKLYPVGTDQKPYANPGTTAAKGQHINLKHPAGIGTVKKTGPNYTSVEGSDGQTYYPSNKFIGVKVTPDIEDALGQIAKKVSGPAISKEEFDADQAKAKDVTGQADKLLNEGIDEKAGEKERALQAYKDAKSGSALVILKDVDNPNSHKIFKKKPDGNWISLVGGSKSNEELYDFAQEIKDPSSASAVKLMSPEEFSQFQTEKYLSKMSPGIGVSDGGQMFEKTAANTWKNIADSDATLTDAEVANTLMSDKPLNLHTPEEVAQNKSDLGNLSDPPEVSTPISEPTETITEQVFGKVYSDDQGEYMVGSGGKKFRKGEKVLTSKGKGEEAEILALYEGVESARVLLPNGKKSIKKINTLVHSEKASEDDSAAPEAVSKPFSQGKPSAMKKQAADAETPVENTDESAYDEPMPTNPALDEEAPVVEDELDPEDPVVDSPEMSDQLEQAAGPIDVSSWTKIKSSTGSNPGGEYEAPDGTHYFVKQSKSDLHAKNEVLASDIYQAAGVNSLELGYANVDGKGKLGTIAPMLDGSTDNFQSKLSDSIYKKDFQKGWAVDAWLGNWDVAGLNFDNVLTDANGQAIRVDPGGALLFRAMGSPKTADQFTDEVTEWDSMRTDPDNYQSNTAFGDMTDQEIVDSVDKVAKFTDSDIDALVDKQEFDEATASKLKQKLKARRDNLISKAEALGVEPSTAEETESGFNESSVNYEALEALKKKLQEQDSAKSVEEKEEPLADWEKELLNSAMEDAKAQEVEPEPEPEIDYAKPGTTYKSPYTGEDTVTGKDKNPIFKGVNVTYTKKGETKTGKVTNILFNQQSASVKWPDGTTSIIKGSQLNSASPASAQTAPVSAPEVEVPSVPEVISTPEINDAWDESKPSAADLPIGSSISVSSGGHNNEYVKDAPNHWINPAWGGEYPDSTIDVVKGLTNNDGSAAYKLTIPETTEVDTPAVAEPTTPAVSGPIPLGWNASTDLTAADMPIGTLMGNDPQSGYKKTGDDEWTSNAGTGQFKYPNSQMDVSKAATKDGGYYTMYLPEGSAMPTHKVEEEPELAVNVWNKLDSPAESLPVGAKLKFAGTTLEKIGGASWSSSATPLTYANYEINLLPQNLWTLEVPENSESSDNSDTVTIDFIEGLPNSDALPIGSKIVSPTGLLNFTKNEVGLWENQIGVTISEADTINNLKGKGWKITYNPTAALVEASKKDSAESSTTSQNEIEKRIVEINTDISDKIDDYFSTYEENASWDMFVTMFDDGEIDLDNTLKIDGKTYFITPVQTGGSDLQFDILDGSQNVVTSFIANEAYGSYNPYYFEENLLTALKKIPPTENESIPPAPVYEDPILDEISIATVNLAFNEFLSQIQGWDWTKIKNVAEPAMIQSNDGKKQFFLQAHPMSTPYFQKFQIIDENGKEIATDTDLMWDSNYGEPKFAGQDILDAIEKELGTSNVAPTVEFNLAEGTKLSGLDYSEFAALPAGTKINYLSNSKVFGTYIKNSNNSWRFQQVDKSKPSHKSNSNADFKFIMDNNPNMAENYEIFAPDAPEVPVEETVTAVKEPEFIFDSVKIDEDILAGYPIGTTVKLERSSYYNQKKTVVYKKIGDGEWEEWNKSSSTFTKKTSILNDEAVKYRLSYETAAVSIPSSPDGVMLGSGEIAYVGNLVYTSGSPEHFTIDKINKSYINLTDSSGNKVKIPSKKLFKDSSYGVKKASTGSTYGQTSKYDTNTNNPLETYIENVKAEKAAQDALNNFAGASATDYDVQGLGLKVGKSALKVKSTGLSVIEVSEDNTSHPLYGTPKPEIPASPDEYPSFEESVLNNLPKWDSTDWLKGVEERYAANPNKKFDSVQKSTQWTKIQHVLDGQPGWVNYLDQLKNSKYVDDDLYKMAEAAIKAQEAANKPLQKAHNENIAKEKAEYEANKSVYMAEYEEKIKEYTDQLNEWSKVNTTAKNLKKVAKIPPPSTTPFVGGAADWTKAHPGTHSVASIMDAMRNDNVLGRFGLSAAVGNDQIEENRVTFKKILNEAGQEKFEINLKVTHAYGKLLASKMKNDPGVNKNTSGIYYPKKTNMMGKADDELPKLNGKPDNAFVNDGTRFELKDSVTGAPVVFQHSSLSGVNVSTMHNDIQIHLDPSATPADLQIVLENLGLAAKPSTAGNLRVTAENKLITLFTGKSNFGDKNFSGEQRTKALESVKKDYGVTVDDVVVETDSNGYLNFFLSDAKTDELMKKIKVKHFHHGVYAGEDVDVWESILTGTNPGLLANYHRGYYGVGVLKSGTGMSPDTDMRNGSGTGIFATAMHEVPSEAPYGSSVGIDLKSVVRRLDTWVNIGDNYGKKDQDGKATFEMMTQKNHFSEIMIRDTVPVSDMHWVSIGSESSRKQLIQRLTDKGIYMINGLPLEEFLPPVGGKIPEHIYPNLMGADLVDVSEITSGVSEAPAAPAAGPAL